MRARLAPPKPVIETGFFFWSLPPGLGVVRAPLEQARNPSDSGITGKAGTACLGRRLGPSHGL